MNAAGIVNCNMPAVQIETAFNVELDFVTAPFHKRLLAYLIDLILLLAYLLSMKRFLYSLLELDQASHIGLDMLVISLPMLTYSLITEMTLNGQTIGKKLMQIRVVSLEGGEPTAGQFLMRWITKCFEWPFFFGYIYNSRVMLMVYLFFTCLFGIAVVITILVSRNSRRLGDMAAGTVVIDAKNYLTVEDTIFMNVASENYRVTYPEVMRLSDNDINTIKSVVTLAKKNNNHDVCTRVEYKIRDVLKIESKLSSIDFLEKLLEDYNYLATKE